MTLSNPPRFRFRFLAFVAAVMLPWQSSFAENDLVIAELDAFWTELARTVNEGDFEAYSNTYHEDAILVSESSGSSYPIANALGGWEQGFIDTKSGKLTASVEFRFTQRLNDSTTAHETGIFKYSSKPQDGEWNISYTNFESLLIKKEGWKAMMEFQQSPATEAEWNAAK